MKKILLLCLLALSAAGVSAQTVTVDSPYHGNGFSVSIQKSGSKWYPFFQRTGDVNVTINYEVYSSSGEAIYLHGVQSLSDAVTRARGTVGDESPVYIRIRGVQPYGGSSSSSGSGGYSGGTSDYTPPDLPPYEALAFIGVSTGYGVSYGGTFGAKLVAQANWFGVSAGYGISPTLGMPKTYSFGVQLHFSPHFYIDTQYAGRKNKYEETFWTITGGTNIRLDRNDRFFLNLALGVGGYYSYSSPLTFIYEFGFGYKIFRY